MKYLFYIITLKFLFTKEKKRCVYFLDYSGGLSPRTSIASITEDMSSI